MSAKCSLYFPVAVEHAIKVTLLLLYSSLWLLSHILKLELLFFWQHLVVDSSFITIIAWLKSKAFLLHCFLLILLEAEGSTTTTNLPEVTVL